MNVQAAVGMDKARKPNLFCGYPKCLWRTGGGDCPRHGGAACPSCRKTKLMAGRVNPTGKRGGWVTCTDPFHGEGEANVEQA